jgi:hypothetical protein
MDAMMAFYRPLAEEARGELPEADLRDMARHCVAQLAQQSYNGYGEVLIMHYT